MKTVFITSFHLLISRNILASPILDQLLADVGIRIVLVVPESKKLFFANEFDRERLTIAGFDKGLTRQEKFLRYLSLVAINSHTLSIKRRTELGGSGVWLVRLIGAKPWFRRAIRSLARRLTPRDRFRGLFERYTPDLVFATDVQNEHDIRMMCEAQDRGVPTLGMVRSWDNLAAKGLVCVLPDVLLVNNGIIKEEAINLQGIPSEIIRVVGIPHYDRYLNEVRSSRQEFFEKIGADPEGRLIVYAPVGDRYLDNNSVDRDIIDLISKNMPADSRLLVRLPPADLVRGVNRVSDARVIFDQPTLRYFDRRNTELTREDDRHLADTLHYADVVITGPSTIAVDAILFDKPVILVGFDGREKRPYYDSVRRYFDYEHWQPVLASKGVRLVRSSRELQEEIHAYFRNPRRDAAGRKQMAEEQCFKLDGRSSERTAQILYEKL